ADRDGQPHRLPGGRRRLVVGRRADGRVPDRHGRARRDRRGDGRLLSGRLPGQHVGRGQAPRRPEAEARDERDRRRPEQARMTRRRELIDVAMGKTAADLVVEGGTIVNVATAELYLADVAVKGDRIAAVGDVAYTKGPDTRTIDASGLYVTPGLVEGHLHQYHSYLGVTEFVQALLTHGVTATADGFYGPGIVAGVPAVRFFKEAFERMPLRLIFLVPTLAWLQN